MSRLPPSSLRYAAYILHPKNDQEKTAIASCYITTMVPDEDAREAAIESAQAYYEQHARHTIVSKQSVKRDRSVDQVLEAFVFRSDGVVQATINDTPAPVATKPASKKQAPRVKENDLTAKIAAKIARAKLAAPATSVHVMSAKVVDLYSAKANEEIAAYDDAALLARYAAKHSVGRKGKK